MGWCLLMKMKLNLKIYENNQKLLHTVDSDNNIHKYKVQSLYKT